MNGKLTGVESDKGKQEWRCQELLLTGGEGESGKEESWVKFGEERECTSRRLTDRKELGRARSQAELQGASLYERMRYQLYVVCVARSTLQHLPRGPVRVWPPNAEQTPVLLS